MAAALASRVSRGRSNLCYDGRKHLPSATTKDIHSNGTILKAVDNSGAKEVLCIQSLKGEKGARLGDIIVGSVKEAIPKGKVKKGKVVYGVIVRAAMQ